jgi:rhodanese-related sulfurtransferase
MTLKTIDANTLKQWLEKREAVLVDVREPAEYAAENIQGATLLPLGSIRKSSLPDCLGKKLVIHCRKGGRGGSACEKLLAEDPNLDIYNLEGGIEAWRAAGLTVASSGKAFLPLDRQVQLAIGLLLITASLLGYFLTPVFFLLTGLIGAGLTIAGVTGFCGLALLMARMPWNQCAASGLCTMK